MFERIEKVRSIYEGVLEPYYKKATREDANHASHSSKKRGRSALC